MAKNSIGGFFVDLGLLVDKHSFETGNKAIDAITGGFNKLIGTAKNAAVVMATSAVAAGSVESASLKTAAAMGIATEKLDMWKAAASIAGVKSEGLVSSMGQLANIMNHMTVDGSGLEAYSEQLGKLGLSFHDLENLDAADAYQQIIEQAQAKIKGGEDKVRITAIVGDILGAAGQNLFTELNRTGTSIGDFLSGAAATQFTTSANANAGADFMREVNTIKEEFKSLSKLFGDEIAEELTPYMSDIAQWIKDNGSEIVSTIGLTAELIGDILREISPLTKEIVGGLGSSMKALVLFLTGDKKGALEAIRTSAPMKRGQTKYDIEQQVEAWKKENGYNVFQSVPIDKLPEPLRQAVLDYNSSHKFDKVAHVKDGIIRPDGQITQVAPDDWVLAARDLGDMAAAFIPQGYAGADQPNTFSIVQNFHVNGGGDVAQLVRQQAYQGTHDGLAQVMAQSSRRLQQMSGML